MSCLFKDIWVKDYICSLPRNSGVTILDYGSVEMKLDNGVKFMKMPKSISWTQSMPTTILVPVLHHWGLLLGTTASQWNHSSLLEINTSNWTYLHYDSLPKKSMVKKPTKKLTLTGLQVQRMEDVKRKIRKLIEKHLGFIPPSSPTSFVLKT